MSVLHTSIRKIWFDMIKKGVKKEEYKEVCPYWTDRLYNGETCYHYDAIVFHCGIETLLVECLGIEYGYGDLDSGAPINKAYIIKLGQVLRYYIDRSRLT